MSEKISWGKILVVALLAVLAAGNAYQYSLTAARPVDPPKLAPEQVLGLFHILFYQSEATWQSNKWWGVMTLQNPNDVWITQEILTEVKPDFVVETGTLQGGSAAIWAMVLSQVNPQGRVITIDITPLVTPETRALPIVKEKVDFILGSSTDSSVIAEVTKRVQGKKVLVLLDSDHSKDHVLKELELYAPLVSVGSYLIVQDTNINGHPVLPEHGPGPWEALDAWLPDNDQFEPDRSRERLLFSFAPRGYLKRVQ